MPRFERYARMICAAIRCLRRQNTDSASAESDSARVPPRYAVVQMFGHAARPLLIQERCRHAADTSARLRELRHGDIFARASLRLSPTRRAR